MKRLLLESGQIAAAVGITEKDVAEMFRDGRVSARFAEAWGALAFGFSVCPNRNQSEYDGIYPDGRRVSVKTLTDNGIRFQHSRYQGAGRTCSVHDLVWSIASVEFFCVVDVTAFPEVKMALVTSQRLLQNIHRIRPAGISRADFWAILENEQLTFGSIAA